METQRQLFDGEADKDNDLDAALDAQHDAYVMFDCTDPDCPGPVRRKRVKIDKAKLADLKDAIRAGTITVEQAHGTLGGYMLGIEAPQ